MCLTWGYVWWCVQVVDAGDGRCFLKKEIHVRAATWAPSAHSCDACSWFANSAVVCASVAHVFCIDVMDMFFLLFFPLCQVMSEKAFPVLDVITAKYGNPENTKRVRARTFTHKHIHPQTDHNNS
jgi:hypothetical protein